MSLKGNPRLLKVLDKRLAFTLAFIIFSFSLFSFNITHGFVFDTDMARDAYNILSIAKGHLTLIGPKHNFGGLYAGPYIYYIFVPVLIVSGYNFSSVLFLNTLFFAIGVGYLFWIVYEKLNFQFALISALIISLSPVYLTASRDVGNGYTFLPFLLILLTYIYFKEKFGFLEMLSIGIFSGFILNIHPITLFAMIPAFSYLFLKQKSRLWILCLLAGIFITFLPVIIFELRHNFVMTTKTLSDFSGGSLIRQQRPVGNNTVFGNLVFLSRKAGEMLGVSFGLFTVVITVFFVFSAKLKNNKKALFWTVFSAALFVFYTFLSRGVYENHYMFPFVLLFIFSFLFTIWDTKFIWAGVLLVLFQVANLNSNIFRNSHKTTLKYEDRVQYVLDNKLIGKDKPFNILEVTDTANLVPSGYGYRYFFLKNGFNPDSVNNYQNSQVLFVFSDVKNLDISGLQNWETGQFGSGYLKRANVYNVSDGEILVVNK